MKVFGYIYTIYTYTGSLFILTIFLNMIKKLFPLKEKINPLIYYGIPNLFFAIIYNVPKFIFSTNILPYYYNFLCLFVFAGLSSLLFLQGLFREKLPYLLYFLTTYKCVVFIFGALYDKQNLLQRSTYELIDFFSQMALLTILYLFCKVYVKHPLSTTFHVTPKQSLLLLYCPISFFTILQFADPSTRLPFVTYVSITATLLLINIPIFYFLFTNASEQYESRIQLGRALSETQAQLTRYRYTILIEEQARKERHEYKNQYFYIQSLMKEKKYEQVEAYLAEHIGDLTEGVAGIQTGNMLLDHILNTKLELAHKHQIKTYTEITIPQELNINENYFCTILLNLLDNAIDASIKEKNPDIQVQINVRNQYLVCLVKNKVSKNIMETNPEFKTTKKDKKNHGLGMKIIQDCVKKANAIFDTSMESNYFTATLMMPIEKDS